MARTATQVFFYVPNLIGYVRVALSLYSLAVALTDFKTSVLCYALSFICDYFDGFFARWFDQCAASPSPDAGCVVPVTKCYCGLRWQARPSAPCLTWSRTGG